MTGPLAVLRPEPGNTATAERVEALGLQAIRLPLFAVHALSWTPPDPTDHDALLLTSANALRFAGLDIADLLSLPVLTVGEKTAETARLAGFDVMAAGNTDAGAMLALASARGLSRVLHLGGRDRSIEPHGPVTRAIPVYASEEVPVAAERIRCLRGATALLHSARAAARLGELVDTHGIARSEIAIAALSPAVAAAAGTGWAIIAIAAAPTDAALIAIVRARD
ncbi:MAG: uroporphyrinogen-III synthase [Sphingomonas sp.]